MLVSGRWAWLFLLASILCSCHQSSKPARFDEVSTNKSIFSTQTSRGIVIGDYDNDGDDDAYIVNADSTEGNRLLRNDGAFVFKDVTEEAKLKALGYSKTAVWFDADNDGWLDLLVGQLTRNRFFHNQGNGKFEEQVSGLEVGRSASALLAADFNGDQWLDVYVCNFMNENSLFINIGFGKFENRIWNSGAQIGHQLSMGAVAVDLDHDGDQDIYCIYDGNQPNRLSRNLGNGQFRETGEEQKLNYRGQGMSVDFADFNHDQQFDFYVTNLNDNALFLHGSDSTYLEEATSAGVNDKGMGWGVICLDYDNDSFSDIYMINQFHFSPFPNRLFRNQGGERFSNVIEGLPAESRKDGFGGASADFNRDGRIDLMIANTSGGGVQLFANQEVNENHYVQFGLVGKKSNKFGVGARIEIRVGRMILIDEVTTGSGYASQNSNIIHLGLGKHLIVDEVKIRWPSGEMQSIKHVLPDQRYLAVEGEVIEPFTTERYQNFLSEPRILPKPKAWFDELTVDTDQSIARIWNEALLEAIRNDFARPTVHARNLYHLSGAMYEAWAAYYQPHRLLLCQDQSKTIQFFFDTPDRSKVREAISYTAFRLLQHRFGKSPGAAFTLKRLSTLFARLGYDERNHSTDLRLSSSAALGNYIASRWINFGQQDGSNEQLQYANQYYRSANKAMIPTNPGNPNLQYPNQWQPLTFDQFIDQSGNFIPGHIPEFQNAEWGNVIPFALDTSQRTVFLRDGKSYNVYLDPGSPPRLDSTNEMSSTIYKWGFGLVAEWATHHSLEELTRIDISPNAIGHIQNYPQTFGQMKEYYQWQNCLGSGYRQNPKTRKPYTPQWVKRGDFTRVLAEFWADGPKSETPPGHWFTILNYVSDHPAFSKQWRGKGATMDDTEWYVKSYLALGGALHDAAITAWGLKGYYDYVRPISAIRYMASIGQSSDPSLENYHPWGLPLKEGLSEIVMRGDKLAGPQNEHLHKVKIRTWKGPPYIKNPKTEMAGVDWILAENWWPYQRPTFITPPFAGFISGHSTYSSAAAEVITLLTGDEFFPGGLGEFVAKKNSYLTFEEGPTTEVVLQWARYKDAADQSALSRIWGGIHPPQDDMPGRLIGKRVGAQAFQKVEQLIDNR
jgi:hypothetical protein